MSQIKTVCVYCGSSNRADESFKQAAEELGRLLAGERYDVVYGGGRVGLMGIVADSALQNGSKVTGIIPKHIDEKEISHTDLTELHVVDSMHRRKQMMVDRADAFIILPGGFGTMDEFFEIFTWWQLGLHDKPIIVVNTEGYWDPLLALIDHIVAHKFGRESDKTHLTVIDTVAEVPDALTRAPAEKTDPRTKWI